MAARCHLQPVREDGSRVETLACCRLAGHAGACCQHIAYRISATPHTTIHRRTGYGIRCGRGAALDGVPE